MVKEVRKLVSVGDTVKKVFSAKEREDILVENFIGLQKAMTNLSIKFENLSDNISKLLAIFELSAKEYISSKGRGASNTEQDILNKLNLLLEQNKIIAKGILNNISEKNLVKETPVPSSSGSFNSPQVSSGYMPSAPLNSPINSPQNMQSFKPKPLQGP